MTLQQRSILDATIARLRDSLLTISDARRAHRIAVIDLLELLRDLTAATTHHPENTPCH